MSILREVLDAIWAALGGKRRMTRAELEVELDNLAVKNPERLDWRNSVVDLLKLVGRDSSLLAREKLAVELGFEGAFPAARPKNGSPEMNIWLHKRVMQELMEHR